LRLVRELRKLHGAAAGLVIAGCAIAASAPLSTSRLGTLAMGAFGLAVLVALVLQQAETGEASRKNASGFLLVALIGMLAVGGSIVYIYRAEGAPGRDIAPGPAFWNPIRLASAKPWSKTLSR